MTTGASNSMDLTGHVALVTGGGRGLGRAFAQALSKSGAAVAVTARSEDQLAETVKLIESAGGRAFAFAGDASDSQSVEQAVAAVEGKLGPVDILVNNAGVAGEIKEEWLTDPEEWWRTLEVNLRGPYMFSRRALPGMIERRRGRIINVSSGAALAISPYIGSYTTSKAALSQYSNVLARQLADTGVTVFAYAPGLVRTAMSEWAANSPDVHSSVRSGFNTRFDESTDTALEVSVNMFMFLASGRADALTGRHISVSDDETDLLRRADEIQQNDLYTLRLRT
jgi:NAD(P)-dependent dehydrogenase (short-subunit alcohol dehydrogenase family)